MIIACISFFNEEANIIRCMESLVYQKNINLIVCIDGAYEAFPSERPFTTDKSLCIIQEYQKRYPLKVILVYAVKYWRDEIQKRNQYLIGRDDDYYLVIDADEELIGVFPDEEFLSQQKFWDINIQNFKNLPLGEIKARVFSHGEGVCYKNIHNGVYYGDRLTNKEKCRIIPDVYLKHHKKRSKTRQEAKDIYYRYLFSKENPFVDKELR